MNNMAVVLGGEQWQRGLQGGPYLQHQNMFGHVPLQKGKSLTKEQKKKVKKGKMGTSP